MEQKSAARIEIRQSQREYLNTLYSRFADFKKQTEGKLQELHNAYIEGLMFVGKDLEVPNNYLFNQQEGVFIEPPSQEQVQAENNKAILEMMPKKKRKKMDTKEVTEQ